MANLISPILDTSGRPFSKVNGRSAVLPTRLLAGYDAARDSTTHARHWVNADRLDADSANSRAVRSKLVSRARYEVANDGYRSGILQSHVNHLVGLGPTLRAQTGSAGFNSAVETTFYNWWQSAGMSRKLWCMAHAKTQDGEAFGLLVHNPGIRGRVQLDVRVIECEQVCTPMLAETRQHIDGVWLDEHGNAVAYDILPAHPGGAFGYAFSDPIKVPADAVVHWFAPVRPGAHRGAPEFLSTLNVGASCRRWREATIAAAEVASLMGGAVLHTTGAAEEVGPLSPFDSLPVEKGAMVALPQGWDLTQLKSEFPAANYEQFLRLQIGEMARPLGMPVAMALADSSQSNFSSAKLDHLTYFLRLDVARQECGNVVLDPLFRAWWREAAMVYGWSVDPEQIPQITWSWPQYPVADPDAEANAAAARMKSGLSSPSIELAARGFDYDDELPRMAQDYGITPDEMRARLLEVNLPGAAPAPTDQQTFQQAAAAWIAAGGVKA